MTHDTTAACATCGGAGWLRRPWEASRGPRELGLERCRCNPAASARPAEPDVQRHDRRGRREWWAR